MAEVLKSHIIKSEARKRHFLRIIVSRFEGEGLLAATRNHGNERLDPSEIQEEAGRLVQTKTEDEILADMGAALPPEAVAFLLRIDAAAKRQLTAQEIRYLPSASDITIGSRLGITVFGSFKVVLWRSLCDPRSEIYQAWFKEGLALS